MLKPTWPGTVLLCMETANLANKGPGTRKLMMAVETGKQCLSAATHNYNGSMTY